MPAILLIATLDTKAEEAFYIKKKIESFGQKVLLANTGVFLSLKENGDIKGEDIVRAGCGLTIEELKAKKSKGFSIESITKGIKKITRELYEEGKISGVLSIGGAQGTDIGTSAMRELPFGVPKFMVSTVASGKATFGPFVGTKDIIIMHSVCDIQGLNVVTRKVFDNAAAAICGMVKDKEKKTDSNIENSCGAGRGGSIAVSMLGTTTPGALYAKELLEAKGYEFVAFHQNGTGGIAMEEMITEGLFKGVLDINLHEIGDRYYGGLHGSIREGRLESAAKKGLPQVIAPGSINYTVQGPYNELDEEMKKRKLIVHNSFLTLVRLTPKELAEVGKITAKKINLSTNYMHVYIPLKGFSYPDTEGREHWDPEGNDAFIKNLRENLRKDIPYDELDMHINDNEFIDIVVNKLFDFLGEK
ncbi:MAG: Tm-1-like ATP-binding domain-containing protein [Spirochaetaceae bacterium]|nr:Tm-1-like ATP-binding domain-containing protein [Spirochaetaceae bacterium]